MSNNRDLPGLHDPRFKSPGFRKAVRIVLNHFGHPVTYASFYKHAKAANLTTTSHWYEAAKFIADRDKPQPTLPDGSTPVSGVYFETSVGKLIEMGTCLNSIKGLTEYNRRLKK